MTEPVSQPEQIKAVEEKQERGASLVEYILLVALIAVICIVTIRLLGTTISGQFSNTASNLTG